MPRLLVRDAARPAAPARSRERGMALVWALFAAVVTVGIIVAGTTTFLAIDKLGTAEFRVDGQARAVAEAGLTDALAWYRRQTTQPVTAFAPVRNLAVSPVVNETDDASIGIVREYEINMPSLWGRYEVRKPVAAEPFNDGNANGRYDYGETFTDTNGNGTRDPAKEVQDVTSERGLAGVGGVWRIVSHGMIFRRADPTKPLGDPKNPLLSSVTVVSEARRLVIVPPASAALCASAGASVTIGARASISGGKKTGLAWATGSGSPSIGAGTVTGTPATGTVSPWLDSVDTVFGAPISTLRGMSDAAWSTAANFPAKIGAYTLHIVPGPITFDTARPLRGTGVVLVLGDCALSPNNNSFFNGVLYVQGNLTIRGPAYVRGTVICTGTVDVAGSGGDFSEIVYDGAMVAQVMTVLGQYRFSTGTYEPAAVLPDGVPDENGLVRLQKTGLALPGGNLPSALGSSLP